ncbi:MAG: hypothetical protein WBP41_07345, partial [Saprospiraceae bacterium]
PTQFGINQTDGDIVLLVDRQRNLLLGSRMYDGGGSPLMCMMIQYDNGTVPTIKAMRQEVQEELPSGGKANVEMISTFSNVRLELN